MPLVRRREPFDDRGWVFEPKLDGFRALAFVDGRESRLVSRNGNTFRSWPMLCQAIATTVRASTAVLDGEVVCLASDGRPDFRALLYRRAAPVFYAFDALFVDGDDLRDRSLIERKRVLRRLIPRRGDLLRYVDHVIGRGCDLFRVACEHDLEGIVAKRKDGAYAPDATSWLKVKNVGYTQARDRHELFECRAGGWGIAAMSPAQRQRLMAVVRHSFGPR
jgi:bifunctional non-homologous end joining protein LigD